MFALRRTRLRMDHHIRGNDFADALFDGVAQSVDLLKACRSRDADGSVNEVTVAGAADAHAVDVQDAIHASHGPGNLLLQAFRRNIQKGVQGAPAEARADPEDDSRDRQTGESVSIDQRG